MSSAETSTGGPMSTNKYTPTGPVSSAETTRGGPMSTNKFTPIGIGPMSSAETTTTGPDVQRKEHAPWSYVQCRNNNGTQPEKLHTMFQCPVQSPIQKAQKPKLKNTPKKSKYYTPMQME